MKVPVKWLKDYVDIDIDANKLGERLTMSGSMAEEIITTGDEIQNVVTGKIVKLERHPDADSLFVCQVDIGSEETIQIITAATNMKLHDTIPVALNGSTLHGGVKIKKGKLRGLESNGMFCSEQELGIAGEEAVHGLMILKEDTPIGKDIKDILGMKSEIIDFEITSNRPDCLSVIGMARETAATLNKTYKIPNVKYTPNCSENINDILKVDIRDSLCRRYIARGVKNIKIEQSPGWIQDRLLEAGVRPINNIVDITNFVMLEFGQPMHAFDVREITTGKIVVERAKDGEKFTTLDGTERTLDENVLNIKNGETTIGLAGIMGGLDSEVKDDTKAIIFEGANFEGTNIRISSGKLGLRTEASSRFEKDLDPNLAELAMDRACSLVIELGAGEVMEGTIDIYPEKVQNRTLEVSSTWLNTFLGTEINKDVMKDYLERLDMKVVIKGDILEVTVPTFRQDVKIKEDVAEEVARIFGYDNIPTTLIKSVSIRTGRSPKQNLDMKLIETLIASGLNQSISYSFISPKAFDKIMVPMDSNTRNAVKIKNPLGEDYSIMRTTTIPSIMESLSRNYSRNNEIARLFEIGKVYLPGEDSEKLPNEVSTVVMGIYGKSDYYHIKGMVENVMEALGIANFDFRREAENPSFHPGKTASLYVNNFFAGVLGAIHPDVAENYEVEEECYVAELNLDILYKNASLDKSYTPLPKFPAVLRDIAMLVDDSVLVKEIEEIIKSKGGSLVEKVQLFDVYKGKQIPEGKKSVAYSILYRSEAKTLTDEEIGKVHDKIVRTLEKLLGAELR